MSTIYRIGLLAVWLVVVSAEFEYSIQNLKALAFPPGVIPQKGDGSLELVNENVKVLLERRDPHLSYAYEMDYTVQDKYFNGQMNDPKQKRTSDCNGLPGLYLQPPPERVKVVGCIPTKSKRSPPVRLYCFTGINFQANEDCENQPGMQVTAKFYHEEKKDILFIIIPVFTPPIEQADQEHAKQHRVLRDLFPIPYDEAAWTGLKPRGRYDDERQYFVADISWLKKAAERAIRLKVKYEWYYPGPVIIDPQLYTRTFGLDYRFWKRFVKRRPKIGTGTRGTS